MNKQVMQMTRHAKRMTRYITAVTTTMMVVLGGYSQAAKAQVQAQAQAQQSPNAGGLVIQGQRSDSGQLRFTEVPPVHNRLDTDARQQLRDFVRDVRSASGEFVQQSTGGVQQQSQSGTFLFERPGKFVWDVKTPYAQKIVSNGKLVYQYDPDLMQVTTRSVSQSLGASPASILFGQTELDESFEVTVLPPQANMVWLRATPKTADAGMAYMDIAFANNLPAELRIHDSFGHTTTIKLRNFRANQALPAHAFEFEVPEGVDVVNM